MNVHPITTPASPSLASPLFDASFDSIESLTNTFTSSVVPTLETTTVTEVALGYHRNQQYSITAMTTSSGAVAERYAYTAYGQPTILNASGAVLTSSAVGNRFTYTDREWDEILGLYHFRARWLSPLAGRFLGRDPSVHELLLTAHELETDGAFYSKLTKWPWAYVSLAATLKNSELTVRLMSNIHRTSLHRFTDNTIDTGFSIALDLMVNQFAFGIGQPLNHLDPTGLGPFCGKCTGARINAPLLPAPKGSTHISVGVGTCTGGTAVGYQRCVCMVCSKFDVWLTHGFFTPIWWTITHSVDTCL
jgi:RHS repeat-associated protein